MGTGRMDGCRSLFPEHTGGGREGPAGGYDIVHDHDLAPGSIDGLGSDSDLFTRDSDFLKEIAVPVADRRNIGRKLDRALIRGEDQGIFQTKVADIPPDRWSDG